VTNYWCELALVDGRPQPSVAIEVVEGRFGAVVAGAEPPPDSIRLAGFTLPGLANAHSHAFHRALRSRTQAGRGTFWTWRDLMYRAAERLQPDTYHRLARAAFAEMAMAGITCVGEFHYVHHQPDGTPYANRNAMGEALVEAASEAGIRITLLDTLYLHGALTDAGYADPISAQRRFSDGTVDVWIERVASLGTTEGCRVGAAIHSVRAVDPDAIRAAACWAGDAGAVVHAHVSEQVAENEACLAHHGRSPTRVFADADALTDRFTAVHATHVTDDDVALLATAGSTVAMCPTTERDLGDGIGPTRAFTSAGVAMALGTDSHAVIDLFEEARALELDERLLSRERGVHTASDLMAMATIVGHRSLGWRDAGTIATGMRADLVTVSLRSVRTAGAVAGTASEAAVFAATAADVTDVIVDGRTVVADRVHCHLDVAAELQATITELIDA
jgi:formiminoglutamate deiminase